MRILLDILVAGVAFYLLGVGIFMGGMGWFAATRRRNRTVSYWEDIGSRIGAVILTSLMWPKIVLDGVKEAHKFNARR